MNTLKGCPEPANYRSLLMGLTDDESAGPLEEHLGRCPACQAAVLQLTLDDDLTRALRGGPPPGGPERERVEELMARLESLRPSEPTEDDRSGTWAERARAAVRQADAFHFLSPPAAQGELGCLGRYRVLGELGRGGMGIVFRAIDPTLDRVVALKVLPSADGGTPRERFLREARAMARVRHDGVAHVYEVGEDGGVCWMAMELLEGEPLDKLASRAGRLPPAEVIRIGREVADALAAAHATGMVHRDVKPANLWREPSGRIKVLDFGLARAGDTGPALTREGAIVGTPAYMSPEQARGEKVTARSDVFSLGCVLYRLATGKVPFGGADMVSTLVAVSTSEVPPARAVNAEVSVGLSALIRRMMAKSADGRPASAEEVSRRLTELASEKPPAPKKRRLRPVALAGAAALVAAALALAVIKVERAEGTLVLEASEDVEVVVRDGGREVTVLDTKTKREWRVRPGKYTFEVRGEKDRTSLEASELTVKSGDREVVKVTFQPKAKDKDKVVAKAKDKGEKPVVEKEPEKPLPRGPSPLDNLDPSKIAREDRSDWQPKELLAVIGGPRRRHWGYANGLVAHPEGKWVASMSAGESRLCFWDAKDLSLLREFPLKGKARSLRLTPDGLTLAAYVVVGTKENFVELYDVSGAEPKHTRRVPVPWGAGPPELRLDGKMLAFDRGLGDRFLLDITKAEPQERVLWTREKGVRSTGVAFTGDGQLLASAGEKGGQVLLWDVSGLKPVQLPTLEVGKEGRPLFVAASPKGRLLAVWSSQFGGDKEQVAYLVDLTGKAPSLTPLPTTDTVERLSFSADGKVLAVTGKTSLQVWDIQGTKLTQRSATPLPRTGDDALHPAVLALAADGGRLFVGTDHGAVRAFDVSGAKAVERPAWSGPQYDVRALAFSRDGGRLAGLAFSRDGGRGIQFWNLAGAAPKPDASVPLAGMHKFLFDGDRRGLSRAGFRATLWEVKQGRPEEIDRVGDRGSFPLCFSPDGKRAVIAGKGEVSLWDVKAGGLERVAAAAVESYASHAAVSPDGKTLAVFHSANSRIALYDIGDRNLKLRREITKGVYLPSTIPGMSFSPDGRLLTTAVSNVLTLTDLDHPDLAPRVLIGYDPSQGGFSSICFTPDGKSFVTCGIRSVRFWDVPTAEQAARMAKAKESPKPWATWELPGPVHAVAVSPCGKYVATGNGDGTVYVLTMPRRPGAKDPEVLDPKGPRPSDELDPAKIAREDRSDWQPKELLAVIGGPRRRHWGYANGLVAHPEGKWVASMSAGESRLCFWDAKDLSLLREFPLKGKARSLRLTPDGLTLAAYVVVGTKENFVELYDVSGAEPKHTRRVPVPWGTGPPELRQDGKVLAFATGKGDRLLLDISEAEPRERVLLTREKGFLSTGAAFTGDGQVLASVGQKGGQVLLWDVSGLKPVQLPTLEVGKEGRPLFVAASPKGRLLAVWRSQFGGDKEQAPYLVDLTGKEPRLVPVPTTETVERLSFSADGKVLAVTGKTLLQVWDIQGTKLTQRSATPLPRARDDALHPVILALSADGGRLFVGTDHGAVRAFDVSGAKAVERPAWSGPQYDVRALAFSRDGGRLAGLADRRTGERGVQFWNLAGAAPKPDASVPLAGMQKFVFDGDRRVMSTEGSRTTLWEVKQGKSEEIERVGDRNGLFPLCFSPDGRRAVMAGKGEVSLWDVKAGGLERVAAAAVESYASHAAVSPDGKTLAVGKDFNKENPRIALYDIEDRKLKLRREITKGVQLPHTNPGMTFSLDGKLLVTQMANGLTLTDLDHPDLAPRVSIEYAPSRGGFSSMCFTPDGKAFVTCGSRSVRFWDVPTAEQAARMAKAKEVLKPWEAWELPGTVHAVAVSPCGKYVATGNGDGTVYVLTMPRRPGAKDPEVLDPKGPRPSDELDPAKIAREDRFAWQPKELRAMIGSHRQRHWGAVSSVVAHPQGKWVASVSPEESRVCFWDAKDLSLSRELPLKGKAQALWLTPDGKALAVRVQDGTEHSIEVYDVSGAEPKRKSRSPVPELHSLLALRPDGMLAVARQNGEVALADGGGEPKPLPGKEKRGGGCVFTGDGQVLACGGQDGRLLLWDVSGPEPRQLPTLEVGNQNYFSLLVASPKGRLLAVCTPGREAHLVDLSGKEPVKTPISDLYDSFAFSADGKVLAAASVHGLGVWDVEGGKLEKRSATPLSRPGESPAHRALALSADGGRVFISTDLGEVRAFDVSGAKAVERPVLGERQDKIQALAFSRDGGRLVVRLGNGLEGVIRFWDLGAAEPRLAGRVPFKTSGSITNHKFVFDGDSRVITWGETRATLWEVRQGRLNELDRLGGQKGQKGQDALRPLCFSRDGKRAVTWQGKEVSLWDVTGGKFELVARAAVEAASAVDSAVSPDGKTLALCQQPAKGGQTITLFDIAGGVLKPRGEITKSVSLNPKCPGFAFSPDGKSLTSWVGGIGPLVLADTEHPDLPPRVVAGYEQSEGSFSSMHFTPDSKSFVTCGSRPGSVRFWDIPTAEQAARMAKAKESPKPWTTWKLPGPVHAVAVSPCGKYVATGNGDGTVYVLGMPERPKEKR